MEQGRARNFRVGYCSIILFYVGEGRRYCLGGGGKEEDEESLSLQFWLLFPLPFVFAVGVSGGGRGRATKKKVPPVFGT